MEPVVIAHQVKFGTGTLNPLPALMILATETLIVNMLISMQTVPLTASKSAATTDNAKTITAFVPLAYIPSPPTQLSFKYAALNTLMESRMVKATMSTVDVMQTLLSTGTDWNCQPALEILAQTAKHSRGGIPVVMRSAKIIAPTAKNATQKLVNVDPSALTHALIVMMMVIAL